MNGGDEGLREELLARAARLGGRAPVRGERPAPAQDNNEDDPLGLRAIGLVPMMMSDDDDSEDDDGDQDALENEEDDDQVPPYCTSHCGHSVGVNTHSWHSRNAVLVTTLLHCPTLSFAAGLLVMPPTLQQLAGVALPYLYPLYTADAL